MSIRHFSTAYVLGIIVQWLWIYVSVNRLEIGLYMELGDIIVGVEQPESVLR